MALISGVFGVTERSVKPNVPNAPTIGTAVAGNAQATVPFTPPVIDGGAAPISYTATSSPGGFTGSAAVSPITVTGLANGTGYTFTVTATNQSGTGAASGASNSVTPTGGSLSPVTQFTVTAQGGSTNNVGSVTTALLQKMLVWAAPAGGLPGGGHYQVVYRKNYGSTNDFPSGTTTNTYFVATGLSTFFNAPNIGQGSGIAIGPVDVFDFDVLVVDSIGNRSAAPAQCTFWHYRGGVTGTANGGSTTTLTVSGTPWSTDQWLGYYVFITGHPSAVIISNTSNSLTFVDLDGNAFSSAVTNTTTFQIGGDYFNGVGDVSFGQAGGSPAFTSAGGSPISPHAFCLGMTHDGTTGNMGLQRPSASPAGFIYGAEVGAYNYTAWSQRPATTGQGNEFAIHHRCPTGDLPGPPVSNISSGAMTSYGPSPVANTWQDYVVPLSALQFSTPSTGFTTFTGSITGGILTVTSFTGPGFDSGVFITGTGVDAGTYISNNSGGQTGNGTYTVLKNSGAATSNASTFTNGKAYGTNYYKGQFKVVGSTFANQTTYYDNICSVRSNSVAPGA